MPTFNRRNFLKTSSLTVLPAFIPSGALLANNNSNVNAQAGDTIIRLYGDGIMYEPTQYIEQLQQFNKKKRNRKRPLRRRWCSLSIRKKI